jgi:hypothetical protein
MKSQAPRAGAAATWGWVALLAIGLAGCTRYYWWKPGGTAEQFDRDHRACALETSANPTEAAHGMVNEPLYRACLQGRQWVRTKEFTPPPPGSYRGFE